MMEVLPLQGIKSIKAFNGFNALVLGLNQLPVYILTPYVQFYESFKTKTDAQKETALREAIAFVELKPDEIDAIISFCKDKNGIPYGPSNTKDMPLKDMFEIIVAVCLEIGKIGIEILSEEEKKNFLTSQSTSELNT